MTTTAILVTLGALMLGMVIGAVVGGLLAQNRAAAARRSADLDLASARAAREAAGREAEVLREQLTQMRDETEQRLAGVRADADARLAEQRTAAEARLREIKTDQDAERQRFQTVASEALKANSTQFLELAQASLKASTVKNDEVLAQREQAFRALVDPMKLSLEQVQAEVKQAEKARVEGQSALNEHLRLVTETSTELRKETGDLVTALRSSQTRGAWGELQLRRTVEAAGMLDRVDFTEQVQVSTDDGLLRPDMVVHLAGGKRIVVDAKVAFLGYIEAQQATDDSYREERLAAHVRHVRKHVDDLASKAYWEQFAPAPEFVVMFMPAEAFLSAAVEREPDLLEYAARKRVIIATPMTLVALLRTAAYAWRQDALADNAQQVLTVGKELYSRLVTMTQHITKTGRSLEAATKSYNLMVGSLERNVLTSARRMVELDVVDAKDAIEEIQGLHEVPRPITKPELLAADEGLVLPFTRDDTASTASTERRDTHTESAA
ncbi:MAG: DNA recombination protein RmuC [Cellulomonadaceae bacterium]|nr:DNA recombination protein RmuC [Cellulomonadaceae bacterium]